MRFVTYTDDDGDRVGVLHHDRVHPLGRGVTMLGLLRDGTLRAAGAQAPAAILGAGDEVPVPPGSRMFDLELEVAAVIGRTGRDIHPDDADAYVAGYTILVDWSARDVQFAELPVRLGPTKGKDTATTLGPVLVTPDELQPWRTGTSFDLTMTVEINGERLGQDRWSSMAFSYADMIAYASRGTEIRPGDVVTVTVDQLGTLTTRVVPGVAPIPIPPARRAGIARRIP